ncbi:MAG: HEAT repeat domain-containing protein [Chloroflexi bacterium]|nr:HEAT repeat domain-containing protein [Chloroflexota bacterium]
MARAASGESASGAYQTRLNPPPAHPDAAHPWDEAYLGSELPRDQWWQLKDEGGGMKDEGAAVVVESASATVREPAPVLKLKPPPAAKPKSKKSDFSKKSDLLTTQPALVTHFTPPTGGYAQRLKRVMVLGQPKKQDELTELIAALGDENSNIRWLAGSALTRLGGLAVVNLLAAYLQTNPGDVARAEVVRVLGLIAETDEDEAVKAAARQAVDGS